MIAAGQSIGNYRILSKIGTGGMGAVYLAEHPLIGKRVALKVIHRELAGNKEVVQRFFQEARAVNKIGNEHIVEVHDFGVTPEGDHFYIMEHIDGRTLASVLTRERAIDVMRALHIGAQMASALAAAHASGVIHRDLKPDNIMLVQRLGDPDFVKVLDFGLAKMFQAQGASAVQTAAGVLLGTPQYMSPEACESKRDLDHRTDVYALGILLFQMMTGVLPFDGDSMGEVLVKQVTQLPPAPRGLNPAIPPSVEQIVLRCLAKHVDARFPTMLALREALLDPEAYLRGSPPMAAARSVTPGHAPADAKQVMQAAEARSRMMMAEALPLQAPPSLGGQPQTMFDGAANAHLNRSRNLPVPGLVQPAEPKMNTMRIATPIGYRSAGPRRIWPVIMAMSLLLGVAGGAFAVAWFRPDEAEVPADAGNPGAGSDTGSGSAVAASAGSGSAVPANAGSGSAAAGSGSDSAVNAGSGSAAAGSGSDSAVPANAGSAAGSGSAGSARGSGQGSAVVETGSASVASVKLELQSEPTGAIVIGPDGKELGKAPLKREWPKSTTPLKLVFRLRGYRDKAVTLSVNENTMMRVELVKIRTAPRDTQNPGNGADGLEQP